MSDLAKEVIKEMNPLPLDVVEGHQELKMVLVNLARALERGAKGSKADDYYTFSTDTEDRYSQMRAEQDYNQCLKAQEYGLVEVFDHRGPDSSGADDSIAISADLKAGFSVQLLKKNSEELMQYAKSQM